MFWVGDLDPPVLLGWDLVDGGKHLDWGGSTQYSDAWTTGVNAWNQVHDVIRKDTNWTVKDADVGDWYEECDKIGDVGAGYGAYIRFNRYNMDQFSDNAKIHAVMHYVGFALGLGLYDNLPDVMNTTIDPTAPITCTMGWDIRTFDELYYNVY